MDSKKDGCDRMRQTITTLAKMIARGPGNYAATREDERKAKASWDMLKEEDSALVVPLCFTSLGREASGAARDTGRKRVLFYAKL